MVSLIRHAIAAFAVIGILVSLCVLIYHGMETGYDIEKSDIKTLENHTTGNIMDQLESMNLINGMNDITSGIRSASAPSASLTDILGAIASTAIGTLQTILGVVTLPFEFGWIIIQYYEIPPILVTGIGVIFGIYLAFILLSAKLGGKV